MTTCVVCRHQIRDTPGADDVAVFCDCASPVPELRPLNSAGRAPSSAKSGGVQWGRPAESWSLGSSRLTGRSRQLGENEELKPLGGAKPAPVQGEPLEVCPWCGATLKKSRLEWHMEGRCTATAHE